MRRNPLVIVGAGGSPAVRPGAWIIGLAFAGMALVGRPAWAQQWTSGSGGTIYYNGGSVGIGTAYPEAKLDVDGGQLVISNSTVTPSSVRIYGGTDGGNTSGVYLINSAGNYGFAVTSYGTGYFSGNVGIGTTNPGTYKLAVNGAIGANEVIVTNTSGWSDYVFQPSYRLRPLREVNAYIRANHHLPDIPSESEVQEKGVSVGEMQKKLLAKVEELTLHLIRQEQENQELRDRIARLEKSSAGATAPAAQ